MASLQQSTKRRIAFADGLRGLAALWVVFFHMSEGGHLGHLKSLFPDSVWMVLFDWGHLGVPVFFLLSGFVMAATIGRLHFNGEAAGKFVLRRLIRLSPPYYFAIAFALGLGYLKAAVLGVDKPAVGVGDVFAHMAYLQLLLSDALINTVFWTLCIEVQFYIVFALLVLLADTTRVVGARYWILGIAALLALLWPAGLVGFEGWKGSFFGFWYAFLAGVLVCWGCGEAQRARLAASVYCLILLGGGAE